MKDFLKYYLDLLVVFLKKLFVCYCFDLYFLLFIFLSFVVVVEICSGLVTFWISKDSCCSYFKGRT